MMLKDFLDWDRIMKAHRMSGGHTEVLDVLFLNGQVLASVRVGDYEGMIAYAYLVYGWTEHVKIVIISDYFGSCSGCDSWEDATDEDVRRLCTSLANDAHAFDSIEEALTWLNKSKGDSAYFDWSSGLAEALSTKLEEIKKKGL